MAGSSNANCNLTSGEQINLLVKFAFLCRVKRHESGEIKLKVGIRDLPRVKSLLDHVDDAKAEVKRIPGYRSHKIDIGITGVDVKIQYGPDVFPYELWQDLSRLRDEPALESKIRQDLHSLFNGEFS